MELSKKTTILLSPRMHRLLATMAEQQGTSMGELVREACEVHYGLSGAPDAGEAVQRLSALELPVGTPHEMKQQSIPTAVELLP